MEPRQVILISGCHQALQQHFINDMVCKGIIIMQDDAWNKVYLNKAHFSFYQLKSIQTGPSNFHMLISPRCFCGIFIVYFKFIKEKKLFFFFSRVHGGRNQRGMKVPLNRSNQQSCSSQTDYRYLPLARFKFKVLVLYYYCYKKKKKDIIIHKHALFSTVGAVYLELLVG